MEIMSPFSEKNLDVLREVLSIGMAKAADALAILCYGEVMLKGLQLQVGEKPQWQELFPEWPKKVVVKSEIKGDVKGCTLLFFSELQLLDLERRCLNYYREIHKDQKLKVSLIQEVSNILTGSIVSQMSNLLNIDIFGSVPKTPEIINGVNKTGKNEASDQSVFVTVTTFFVSESNGAELPMVIIFDTQNLEKLLSIVKKRNFKDVLVR